MTPPTNAALADALVAIRDRHNLGGDDHGTLHEAARRLREFPEPVASEPTFERLSDSFPKRPTARPDETAVPQVLGTGFYRDAKPGTFGRSEWLDLLMACQDGRATCMRVLEIIEREVELQTPSADKLVDAFLAWPLPESVCADLCATERGYPHRSGTNLLTATEAKQMVEHLFAKHHPSDEVAKLRAEVERLKETARQNLVCLDVIRGALKPIREDLSNEHHILGTESMASAAYEAGRKLTDIISAIDAARQPDGAGR